MIEKIAAFLKAAFRWVRYLYFLRFSLGLLAFAPLMIVLNGTGACTLIRGILVPEHWEQYLCVTFFLVSAGFAALVLARVVLANGPERFNEGIPSTLKLLLVNDNAHWLLETVAVVLFQLPNLYVFFEMFGNSQSEGVPASEIWPGFLIGTVLAGFIWWSANAWFYLTYDIPAQEPGKIVLGKTAARTMLFPRAWFGLHRPGTDLAAQPPPAATLETAYTPLRYSWLTKGVVAFAGVCNRLVRLTGYLYPNGTPYEGHIFVLVTTVVLTLVYVVTWPLTAPVPARGLSIVMLVVLAAAGGLILVVFWGATPGSGGRLFKWQLTMTIGVAGFWLADFILYVRTAAERFPVFAVLLLTVTLVMWVLAGIAFFVDRYRVPVLTTLLVLATLPRMLGWYGDSEEHYFSTTVAKGDAATAALPTPAAVLDMRLADLPAANQSDYPLIIVTSTGGGLHASAWTSAVLAQLEMAFQNANLPFRQNVLLMSTVSGGSVGLLSYLREIENPSGPNWVRMQTTAQCSSLEAVGWALAYYDIPKATIPFMPLILPQSSGDGDLSAGPLFKDRTWALRKAFGRNLSNPYCNGDWPTVVHYFAPQQDKNTPQQESYLQPEDAESQNEGRNIESWLAVRNLIPASGKMPPAFTMNTTTVERGERFLLSNYHLPQYPLDSASDYPAQSFVDAFGCCKDKVFDLPLATAAQLSATFPIVSSATRAPVSADWHSVHMVDGGYYDNDGTASILEFLRYALVRPKDEKTMDPEELQHHESIDSKLQNNRKLRILLIEIRNSPETLINDETVNKDTQRVGGGRGAVAEAWNLLDQAMAPLEGFWNAGHEAVTARNLASLSLLERALQDRLQVHRVVFPDLNSAEEVGTDPLSWSLTPKERTEVLSSSCPQKMGGSYKEVVEWFRKPSGDWKSDFELVPNVQEAAPGAAATPAALAGQPAAKR